jgi:DUF3040 family protein
MALSERELRILRDLEDSLRDVEQRCHAIQRRMQRGRTRLWLILLCVLAPIVGAGLILLGAMTHQDGIAIAVLGSAVLAIPCVGVSPLCNKQLWEPAKQPETSP